MRNVLKITELWCLLNDRALVTPVNTNIYCGLSDISLRFKASSGLNLLDKFESIYIFANFM